MMRPTSGSRLGVFYKMQPGQEGPGWRFFISEMARSIQKRGWLPESSRVDKILNVNIDHEQQEQ